MPLWDKLRTELDRAGKAAAQAIDEGKIRLEAFRARQLADKSAQSLGYAVFRARESGQDLDTETYARIAQTLREREAECKRLEDQLRAAGDSPPPKPGTASSSTDFEDVDADPPNPSPS